METPLIFDAVIVAAILVFGMLIGHVIYAAFSAFRPLKKGTRVQLKTPFIPVDKGRYQRFVVSKVKGTKTYALSKLRNGKVYEYRDRSDFNVVY